MNIGDIYAIGLVSQGIILANVAIMLRKGEIIEHKERIEALYQAGIHRTPAAENGRNLTRK